MWKRAILVLVMSVLMVQGVAKADEEVPPTLQTPKSTVESLGTAALLQRIEELETKVALLESQTQACLDWCWDFWTDWTMLTLDLTAYHNCYAYLSEKLVKTSLRAFYSPAVGHLPGALLILVDTDTQPAWNVHVGAGRFSVSDREVRVAFSEAADYIYENILNASLKERLTQLGYDIVIEFSIRGAKVGTWTNGTIKLAGE